jgi:hypothetical protein
MTAIGRAVNTALTCTRCGTVQDLAAGPDGTKPDAEITALTEQHHGYSADGPAAG